MALFLVPTPLGNLGDLSARVIETLRRVDFVIAEDSRPCLHLLNHLGIRKRIYTLYRPREEKQTSIILPLLKNRDAALVSDAGTPTISDPGFLLVSRAIAENITVIALPGPVAFVPALVASGIDPARFLFLGFPPRKSSDRLSFLLELADLPYTLVFYESPRRVTGLLAACHEAFGDRAFALAKEISKKNEKTIRGRLSAWAETLAGETILGEMTLVIAGGSRPVRQAPSIESREDLYNYFKTWHGIPKNRLKAVIQGTGKEGKPGKGL